MSSISVIRVKNGGQQEISSLEAIHNVALEVSKFKNSNWDLADLTLYQFYCCPECTYKSQKDFLFRDHMRENHENIVSSKKIKLDASTLIHRFLQEDNNTEIHSIDPVESNIGVNISNQIDVIKNPPMRLPLPDYSQSLSIINNGASSTEEPRPNNFALSNLSLINLDSKSPFSITIKPQSSEELASANDDPPDDLLDYVDSNSNNEHFDFDQAEDFLDAHSMPEEIAKTKEETEIESKPQISTSSSSTTSMDKDSKKCQDCSIVFLTPFRLQRHIKKFHGGLTPTMANSETQISDDSQVSEMPRPYACQLCQKSFTSHAYLASHIRKAHEKRFRCQECGKCYGGSSYLREHIEAVHRKTKNFTCESCAASFYSKTQLTNHCLRNHTQGEDQPCPECGKVFSNELSLKLHLRNVHQPVKSMCSQCGKEYPNEVSLKKHIQCVHEKMRPFQCHICSKMFGSKWYVQQHILKMHEDMERVQSFKCSDCDFEFTTMRDRNAHVLKDHGKKFVGKPKKLNTIITNNIEMSSQQYPDLPLLNNDHQGMIQ